MRGDALFLQRAALFALFDLLWALESAQTPADAALPSGATWKLGVLRDQLHARYEADGPSSDSAADFDELLDALDGLGDRVARVEAMAPDGGSAVAAVLRESGVGEGLQRRSSVWVASGGGGWWRCGFVLLRRCVVVTAFACLGVHGVTMLFINCSG